MNQLRAHAELSLFSTDDMRDAGFFVETDSPQLVQNPRSNGKSYSHFDLPNLWPQHVQREPTADESTRLLREPTADEMRALGLEPYEVREFELNVLVTAGITRMLNLLSAIGATQAYDATHTSLAVGDGAGSVPTVANTDTDLAATTGATHRDIQPVDATFPSVASGVWTAQATITSGNGLFHWREWAITQDTAHSTAAATAPLLNHRGTDMGDFTGTSIAKALKVTLTPS